MNTMNSDLPLTHYKNYNIVNLMEVLLLPLFCPLTILPSLHAHSEFAPRANFPIQSQFSLNPPLTVPTSPSLNQFTPEKYEG